MSMIKQNQGNENAHKTPKTYIWNKSWVRPYESPISVYMNFVGINALSYFNLKQLWNSKDTSSYMFRKEINYFIYGNSTFVNNVISELFPDDYYFFPTINGNIKYRQNFHYCPECIKQGYHSMLSQMPGENVCPVHKIPYIDHGSSVFIGMKGRYDIYEKMFGKFPLPPEREQLDLTRITAWLNGKYPDVIKIGFVAPLTNDINESCYDKYISQGKKEVVTSISKGFNYANFEKKVWNYFIKKAEYGYKECEMMYQSIGSIKKYLDYFKDRRYSDNLPMEDILYRVLIMACMLDYIKDINNENYPGSYPHLYTYYTDPCSSDKYEVIKASYCYAVRGNYFDNGIFSLDYIVYQAGGDAKNVRYTYATQLETTSDNVYHATIDFMCLSGMKKTELQSAIGCICVYDQFWFQADRYMKHIREKKEFSYYEEWKSISPVVYEIDQDSTGDVYIYRISL